MTTAGDQAADAAGDQRADALPEQVLEGRRGRDAVPLADVADEQDLAGRGRRRDRAEDRELAQPPRRHDDENSATQPTAAQNEMAGDARAAERQARQRSHTTASRARPGPAGRRSGPASRGPQQPGEDERPRRRPGARGRPARAPPRRAAGRARSCRAGRDRPPTAAGSRRGCPAPTATSARAPASRAIAQVSGAATEPMSANGAAAAHGWSPKTARNGTWTIDASGIQWAFEGIGQDRVGRDVRRRPRRRSR